MFCVRGASEMVGCARQGGEQLETTIPVVWERYAAAAVALINRFVFSICVRWFFSFLNGWLNWRRGIIARGDLLGA